MKSGVIILHLTDIHIGMNDFPYGSVEEMAIRIGQAFDDQGKEIELVLVTGDIFNGKANWKEDEENIIEQACIFFEVLLDRLQKTSNSKLTKDDFLFTPGNHEINRNASNENDKFKSYKKFLEKFHGTNVYDLYNEEFLYSIRVFDENKIIVIGFNSCKFFKNQPSISDFRWIEELDFEESNDIQLKEKIKESYKIEISSKFEDYGYIEAKQYVAVLDELRTQISDFKKYTTVVAFHHHFFPFPETNNKNSDSSTMRDFEYLSQKLIDLNTKLILHGHKHLPLIRPIIQENYFSNPDSLIFAVAGGNIGSVNQWERHFQLIEAFNYNNYSKIAHIYKYNFVGDKPERPKEYILPPEMPEETSVTRKLSDILKQDSPSLYSRYQREIYDCDKTSRKLNIDSLIVNIGNILTSFSFIKENLLKYPEDTLYIILFIHYKIHCMESYFQEIEEETEIRNKITDFFVKDFQEDFRFISSLFLFF